MGFKEKKEKKKRKPFGWFLYLLDINFLASLATSWVFHAVLLLLALFLWTETLDMNRRTHIYQNLGIYAVYDFERDEEEAIERIVEAGGVDPETGRELPSFPSVEDAVAAAVARSDSLGMSEVSPSLIPRLGSIPGFPGLSRPFR